MDVLLPEGGSNGTLVCQSASRFREGKDEQAGAHPESGAHRNRRFHGERRGLASGESFQSHRSQSHSYQVADYGKTRDFYVDLLGMGVTNDDGTLCRLGFGDSFIVARETGESGDKPRVDHFAITIANWDKDAVEAELTRRGLDPRPDTDNSFIVKDPDGFDLQISGEEMKA